MYQRKQFHTLLARMLEKRRFIQVIMGPRQVGKSTLMKQVVNAAGIPFVFYPADAVPATQPGWISGCWNAARAKMRVDGLRELILVIDEIQKINGWSEVVKKEWDSDTFYDINLKVVLLGSSRVMLDKVNICGGKFYFQACFLAAYMLYCHLSTGDDSRAPCGVMP